ncbi:MAG: hypothetical protein NTW20_17155 [Rhodobacterales bacterium]|nr:hypothetical protein [Rhodobacterales bacterium]
MTLECKIADLTTGGGYITEVYAIQYDEAAGKALVADGLIMYVFDAPIPAKVADDTAKKLVFSWTVQLTNSSAQQLKMQFRASYFKETGKFTVRASPGGAYSNDFEGRGSCKIG